jgi:hypothetical protein
MWVLSGEALKEAESWLASSEHKAPAPTALHHFYITASQQAVQARRRLIWRSLAVGLVIILVLAGLAWQQSQERQQESEKREVEAERADQQAAVVLSQSLATSAEQASLDGDSDLALRLALEAVRLEAPPSQRSASWQIWRLAPAPGRRLSVTCIRGWSRPLTS